jgi:hypothetical protein
VTKQLSSATYVHGHERGGNPVCGFYQQNCFPAEYIQVFCMKSFCSESFPRQCLLGALQWKNWSASFERSSHALECCQVRNEYAKCAADGR